MKKIFYAFTGIVLTFALVTAVALLLSSQEQVHEHIEVVQQEIVVRVFSGSNPVSGLTAGDFSLYEDGKQVKIGYCREQRRSLTRPEIPVGTAAAASGQRRLFLFMIWLDEESQEWTKAWDYFLGHVYRSGDRIILNDGTRTVEVTSPEKDREKIKTFFAGMAEAMRRKKAQKTLLVKELETITSKLFDTMVHSPFGDVAMNPTKEGENTPPGLEADLEKPIMDQFKQQYSAIVDEYRMTRLKGYTSWLERLAGALKAVEAEKWVLVFMQNERLPLLSREGRLFSEMPMKQSTINDLRRLLNETEKRIELDNDLTGYMRDLQPLFIGANATYHLFLCDAARESLTNQYLQWRPVFSSWEGAFRQISADTGGRVSDTTRLGEAMEKAAASEDIYYILSYEPAEGKDRQRDLRIEMKRSGLKAAYSRKLTLSELFPLKIQDVKWQDGALKVSLADFQRTYGEAGLRGRLRIAIKAEIKDGVPLVSATEIQPIEPAVDVEMALNFPAPGRYLIKVDVEDRLTGHRAQAEKEIEILPAPASTPAPTVQAEQVLPDELRALFVLTSDYCRRLKEGAFRFYCLEKVEEKFLQRDPQQKQKVETIERRWQYDYQITGAGGEIQERRRLVRDGARKVDQENASLETRFASRYSVFLPVTLLAPENRAKYAYRILDHEKVKKRRCTVVEVLPHQEGSGGIAQGKAWIDEEDGSVLKIEINPGGVAGVQALEKAAKSMLARLLLEVNHLYYVEHGGLRFPSMTTFREAYVFEKTVVNQKTEIPFSAGEGKNPGSGSTTVNIPRLEQGRREVEFYRLRQDYEKYRFFEVKSREVIKDPPL